MGNAKAKKAGGDTKKRRSSVESSDKGPKSKAAKKEKSSKKTDETSEDESEKKVTKKRTTPKVKLSSPKKDEEKNEGDDLEKSYESKSRKVKKMAVNEGKVDYDSHSSMDSDDEAFIPEYESDVLEDTVKEEYDSAPVSSSDSEDGDAGDNA